MKTSVSSETTDRITTITLSRPERRNAVDAETARGLVTAFQAFEQDDRARVAVLHGDGGNFCAGFDLQSVDTDAGQRLHADGEGPMGPTRMSLSKPVIAAVEGYAVAGGLELALWCDLRIASESAVFGVFCRRFGVPLMDGGTVRLPRLIGTSRAMDMILTGRAVDAREAFNMGLANRKAEAGEALQEARELAARIAEFPQHCLRSDRRSCYENALLPLPQALKNEHHLGMEVIASGETQAGAHRFTGGQGRHGHCPDKGE